MKKAGLIEHRNIRPVVENNARTLIFYVFPYQEVMCLHSLVVEGVVFNVAYHEERKIELVIIQNALRVVR